MVTNQKATGRAASMPVGIGVGVVLSGIITLVLSCVLTWLILGEKMPESSMGYGIIGILLAAALSGALVSAKRIGHRKMLVCLGVGLGYFLMLLMCTALFFGGQYQGLGVTAAVVFGGSGTAGLLASGGGKGKRQKRRRTRPC